MKISAEGITYFVWYRQIDRQIQRHRDNKDKRQTEVEGSILSLLWHVGLLEACQAFEIVTKFALR